MIEFITKQTAITGRSEGINVSHDINLVIDFIINASVLGLDTETTGDWDMRSDLLAFQVGNFTTQYVVDWQSLSIVERHCILEALTVTKALKILQNGKFDLKFFFQYGYYIRNIFDTLVAECLIYAGKNQEKGFFALDMIAERRIPGSGLDKQQRGLIHIEGFSDRVIRYCAGDVKYLEQIARQQKEELIKLKMASSNSQDLNTVLGIENRSAPMFALMEYNGMRIDLEKWDDITDSVRNQIIEKERQLDSILSLSVGMEGVGDRQMSLFSDDISTNINWGSSAQKLKVLQRINPEITSSSAEILYRHKDEHPIIPEMIEYAKLVKLYTGFLIPMKKYINPHTGRIHTRFWQNLETGRVSTGGKATKRHPGYPNMLNIPARTPTGKLMRGCFVAEKDRKYVGGDYSGCELRIIAELSQDPLWIEVYKRDGDLHSELCVRTFNISMDQVKSTSHFKEGISYRDIQKTIDFGLAYGMSEVKLSDTMQVAVEVARQIIRDFFAIVPMVEKFLNILGNFATKNGYMRTPKPFGRIRWFPNYRKSKRDRGEAERAGKNHCIQGANADIIKLALAKMYDYILDNGLQETVFPVLEIYDEIQTEVVENYAAQWKSVMETLMLEAGAVVVKSIPMKVDVKIGDNWGETK